MTTRAAPTALARPASPAPAPGATRAVWRALGYLRAYRRDALLALGSLLLVTAANLSAPQFVRLAVDGGIARGDSRTVLIAVLGLVGVAILRGLLNFAQGFLAERASQGVAFDLREALFARTQRLSFAYYDRTETGQLVTRLTNDVEQVRTFVGGGAVQMVAAGATLVGTAILLLTINPGLGLVALSTVVPIAWLLVRFVRSVGPRFTRVQQSLGRLNSILREDLTGVRVIRAFGREGYEQERYGEANASLRDTNLVTIRAISSNFPAINFFANAGTVAVVWVGGGLILGGRLSLGELIAFNTYLSFLLQPILTLGFLGAALSRAGASAVRVFEVLDAPEDVRDAPDAVPLPSIRGEVEFRDVHFRYPGSQKEVLRGVSFRVPAGQTVAVLGTTGSGKSTLTQLVPRFYDVTSGAVLIDGHDVRGVTLESLRSQVGIVLQEALLFSGTVRDNVAYGRPGASLEDVVAAAKAAQADDFISALPQGYDTVIGERGVGLSGGQRQRIAIARALLVDPRLLILDDSTSAVDAATEAAFQSALGALLGGHDRTAIIIAQRASTLRLADLVVILDDGRVAASGTPEELRETSALYHEILGAQAQPEAVR